MLHEFLTENREELIAQHRGDRPAVACDPLLALGTVGESENERAAQARGRHRPVWQTSASGVPPETSGTLDCRQIAAHISGRTHDYRTVTQALKRRQNVNNDPYHRDLGPSAGVWRRIWLSPDAPVDRSV